MSVDRRALATSLEGIAAYLEHHEDDAADLRAAAAVLRQDADLAAKVERLRAGIDAAIEEYDGDNITAAAAVVEELRCIAGPVPVEGRPEGTTGTVHL